MHVTLLFAEIINHAGAIEANLEAKVDGGGWGGRCDKKLAFKQITKTNESIRPLCKLSIIKC